MLRRLLRHPRRRRGRRRGPRHRARRRRRALRARPCAPLHRAHRGADPRPRSRPTASTRTAATSWPGSRAASTRRSTRWSARSTSSAASSRTPRTSCALRSRACARTCRCWHARTTCRRTSARRSCGRPRTSSPSCPRWSPTSSTWRAAASATSRARTCASTSWSAAWSSACPPRNGVRFETDLRPSTVHGMPAAISRAATNLLDNAVKWSPPDGVVTVRVSDGELRVMDSGPGFDPVDLPYVFNRFYRADSARGMPGLRPRPRDREADRREPRREGPRPQRARRRGDADGHVRRARSTARAAGLARHRGAGRRAALLVIA